MNYEKLKTEIGEIVTIASSVPEKFQERCFDALLESLLHDLGNEVRPPASASVPGAPPPAAQMETRIGGNHGSLPIKVAVRAFMVRTGVTEEQLAQVLLYEDGDVHFVHEPQPKGAAEGQIQWALLLALRNGLLNNTLSVDAETVRSMCQEKGCYSQNNFKAIFQRNARLFRGVLEPQGDPQTLSPDGQDELADLIRKLASGAS